jgi:hypothetical protein
MKENFETKNEFEIKKTKYFSKLSLRVIDALRTHKGEGMLWERNAENKRDWGNVSEHCLAEVARIEIISEMLKFDDALKKDLITAAALHDYNKKFEISEFKDAMQNGRSVLEGSYVLDEKSNAYLKSAGFNEKVIDLKNSVGAYPKTLIKIKYLLDKEVLNDTEIAIILVFYVDGYTINAEWVEKMNEKNGKTTNDLDKKIVKIASNPNYIKIEDETREAMINHSFFHGMNGAEGLVAVGHIAEDRLSKLIRERSAKEIDPIKIPETVDEEIKKRILQI